MQKNTLLESPTIHKNRTIIVASLMNSRPRGLFAETDGVALFVYTLVKCHLNLNWTMHDYGR